MAGSWCSVSSNGSAARYRATSSPGAPSGVATASSSRERSTASCSADSSSSASRLPRPPPPPRRPPGSAARRARRGAAAARAPPAADRGRRRRARRARRGQLAQPPRRHRLARAVHRREVGRRARLPQVVRLDLEAVAAELAAQPHRRARLEPVEQPRLVEPARGDRAGRVRDLRGDDRAPSAAGAASARCGRRRRSPLLVAPELRDRHLVGRPLVPARPASSRSPTVGGRARAASSRATAPTPCSSPEARARAARDARSRAGAASRRSTTPPRESSPHGSSSPPGPSIRTRSGGPGRTERRGTAAPRTTRSASAEQQIPVACPPAVPAWPTAVLLAPRRGTAVAQDTAPCLPARGSRDRLAHSLREEPGAASRFADRPRRGRLVQQEAHVVLGDEDRAEETHWRSLSSHRLCRRPRARADRLELLPPAVRGRRLPVCSERECARFRGYAGAPRAKAWKPHAFEVLGSAESASVPRQLGARAQAELRVDAREVRPRPCGR